MTATVGREYPSYYKWVMLASFVAMNFLANFCQFQPSFFAQDIMDTFGITSQLFTLMTSLPMAVGLFLAIVAGQLSDKFGLHKTVFIALLVSAIGGIIRAFCGSYVPLLIMTLLIGFTSTFCNANIAKVAMMWFPARQVSMAVGIINAGAAAGLAVAQGISGLLFDDFYTAFLWGGIAMAVLCALWGIFGRDKLIPQKSSEADGDAAEGKGIGDVVKSRNLWFAGLGGACYNGFNVTIGSLLITALVATWGTDQVVAGITASLFTVGCAVGSVAISSWIVHVRKAKAVCILLPIVSIAMVYIGWSINVDALRFVLFPIAGFIFGSIYPICLSYPSILPEVDEQNSGAAGGLITSIALAGGIIVPTFIVTPIAGTDYRLMMNIVCCIGLVIILAFAMLPSVYSGDSGEDGSKA